MLHSVLYPTWCTGFWQTLLGSQGVNIKILQQPGHGEIGSGAEYGTLNVDCHLKAVTTW